MAWIVFYVYAIKNGTSARDYVKNKNASRYDGMEAYDYD
jgi:hypothetical protein